MAVSSDALTSVLGKKFNIDANRGVKVKYTRACDGSNISKVVCDDNTLIDEICAAGQNHITFAYGKFTNTVPAHTLIQT